MYTVSSGSGGPVRGAEKHKIYAATFSGHLFYDLFLQGRGGFMAPLAQHRSATDWKQSQKVFSLNEPVKS